MRRRLLTKMAGLLTFTLILSILSPVLAFAMSFDTTNTSYKNGSVTADVYDNGSTPVDGSVTMSVYSPDHTKLQTVTDATYTSVTGSTYHYNFSHAVENSYDYLNLALNYNTKDKLGHIQHHSVTDVVYNTTPASTSGGGGCGFCGSSGGGGIPVGGSSGGTSLQIGSDGEIAAGTLSHQLQSHAVVTLKLSGNHVQLPASALAQGNGHKLMITSQNATFVLPANLLDLNDLAKQLGVSLADMTINIQIQPVTGDALTPLQQAAQEQGVTLQSTVVQFKVTAQGGGQTVNIDSFGSHYVKRQIQLNQEVNPVNSTGAVYDEHTKSWTFVPSTFSSTDGSSVASIERTSDSIYAVVTSHKSFNDIANHWARDNILLLANKLIVKGETSSTFAPNRHITRAEFAALLVRSLGLTTANAPKQEAFSDVNSSDWYDGAVNAAVRTGIIQGYPDGTFRPNDPINREELAAMVVRAAHYAGLNTTVSASDEARLSAEFLDSDQIVWAQQDLAYAVKTGIVKGMSADQLDPRSPSTRAQAVTMLKRYLVKSGFMNQ